MSMHFSGKKIPQNFPFERQVKDIQHFYTLHTLCMKTNSILFFSQLEGTVHHEKLKGHIILIMCKKVII